MNISGIRVADKPYRLEQLMQQLASDFGDSSYSAGNIITLEYSLQKLQKKVFYINQGRVIIIDEHDRDRIPTKTIIREDMHTGIISRSEAVYKNYQAYTFLENYLGLGAKPPLSDAEMEVIYPELCYEAGSDWLIVITEALLAEVGGNVFR